jgi:hypothetical protein
LGIVIFGIPILEGRQKMTPDAFLELWRKWGFPLGGNPADAAVYLHEALLAFSERADNLIDVIGGLDGQQEFVTNCMVSMGLIYPRRGEIPDLTPLGKEVLEALEGGIQVDAFVKY